MPQAGNLICAQFPSQLRSASLDLQFTQLDGMEQQSRIKTLLTALCQQCPLLEDCQLSCYNRDRAVGLPHTFAHLTRLHTLALFGWQLIESDVATLRGMPALTALEVVRVKRKQLKWICHIDTGLHKLQRFSCGFFNDIEAAYTLLRQLPLLRQVRSTSNDLDVRFFTQVPLSEFVDCPITRLDFDIEHDPALEKAELLHDFICVHY